MGKVSIENGWLEIRMSWLERALLGERSERLPLSSIEAVNPRPALLDLLLYWTDKRGTWLAGATPYEGYLVPSARKPNSVIALQVQGRTWIYVELDEEEPEQLAARIEAARTALSEPVEVSVEESKNQPRMAYAQATARGQFEGPGPGAEGRALERREEWEDEDIRLRDPLMQGSLAPPPHASSNRAAEENRDHLRLDNDRDLGRLGGWLVALGAFGVLTGTTIVAAGLLPGLLAVGAGLACGAIGGLTLALVAHHQG